MFKKFENELLECERWWVFGLLMCISGYYGAFTYTLRGGVFCNAQTANFVLFGMAVGTGDIKKALYLIIPITAYLLGAVISELVPNYVKRSGWLRWDTLLIAIEIVTVALLGLVPDNAPFQISQVAINFICSMQYNTFRQADKVPMATTFCTNHLRQTGIHLVKWLKHNNGAARARFLMHCFMLACFITGAVASAFMCSVIGGKAIWGAEILLLIVFLDLIHADLFTQRDMLDRVPSGH